MTTLAVRVTGPNGIDVRRRLTFDVKVPAGDIKRLTVSSLAAKGGKITLSADLFHDLIPRRSKATITVGPRGHPRRAGHPGLARPLPLRLRRADGEPRPAAALRQRRGQAHRARHRRAVARAHRRRHRPRAGDAGLLGRLRHLGAVRRRHVADQLRHRLPDARQGSRLRSAAIPVHPGARSAAELHRLCAGLPVGRRGACLCALCAGPQRPGADRRIALLRRHQARQLLHPAGAGPARRGARHDRRQGSRRDARSRRRSPASPTRTTARAGATTAAACATRRR